MPRIVAIPENDTNTATFQLDKEGLIIDDRVMLRVDFGWRFECVIVGTNLCVTRVGGINIHEEEWWRDGGWWDPLYFRVYDPSMEDVPDFTSRSYRYHGLEHEKAPFDVEEVTVDKSATVIRENAFRNCKKMKRCIMMGDNVKRIEAYAFWNCESLKNIRLSKALRHIGQYAFWGCESIECLLIPPNVEEIQYRAFLSCKQMKILMLPANIDLRRVGNEIVKDCPKLWNGSVRYDVRDEEDDRGIIYINRNRQVKHWLKHRYDLLPLIRLCTNPNITANIICDFMQKNGTAAFHQATDGNHGLLLPLHILTRYNPYATKDAIVACFDVNPSALFIPDLEGKTPLDNLWENEDDKADLIVHLMQDLSINRQREDAAAAAGVVWQ